MYINELRELAQDVGMAVSANGNGYWDSPRQLFDFSAAIEARTKENCAKVCVEEEKKALQLMGTKDWTSYIEGMGDGAGECAEAIRVMP